MQSLGPGIQARAGVLTGEAAVTLGATNQGMVAGDLVNTASRLQSVAQPGTVLVGESTYRASSAAIVFEPAGDQTLKGKQSPVPAWRAVRVVAERGGRNRNEALEAPFVGRHEEMRLLKDLFHTTGREKRLRVVSVIGPAGIGKSRLAWEFALYIDGLADDVYWHSGRSPAYGEGITFWALGEMVRERAGLRELDDEQTTRAKITETVAQWVPDTDEREWIESSLLALLGVEIGHGRRPAVRRLAHLLRAHRRAGHGRARVRGHALRRHRAARLRRPPARLLARAADLRRDPGSTGPDRSAARLGRRQAQLRVDVPRAAARAARCASCSLASCPACPTRPWPRSSREPTAFRSTRSRRCGRSSPTDASSRAAACTCPTAT